MSNPFDIPTPPKKRTPNNSRDDYEEMFPSSSAGGLGNAANTNNVAARMYADEEDEEDASPWGTNTNTRYTQSADYHRSIDTEVRSSGGGFHGGGMAQSGGYFGRGDYEEEEEELADEEDGDAARYGTQGTNTQRSSYNSAMQTQSTTAGGGGSHMGVRSSLQSGGSITPPQATSPNPGRTSTSSLRTSVSAESYKSFGNRLRNVIKQSQEHGSRVKAKNDARAEELAMNRRYKGGHQLLLENSRQEVTMASSYGTLDPQQPRSLDVSRDSRDERGGGAGGPPGSAQKKVGFFARRRGASSESVDQQQQPPQAEGEIKSKKTLKHKMKSLQRRTGQMVLETVRVVEKPKDEDFNNLWKRVQKSDKILQQLGKESTKFLAALKEVSLRSKEISTLLLQYAEGDESEDPRNHANAARSQGGYEDIEFRKQKDLVIEKATKLLDVTRSIDDRIIPMCADAMQNSFCTIREKRSEQFPTYQPCVDKRTAYMRDMDAYERRLEAAQNAKKKDMEYIDKSKRKADLSQNRFQTFSSRLVEDLVLFDGSRFETCGELVDTFAESLNFTVDREQDVLKLVSGTSDK